MSADLFLLGIFGPHSDGLANVWWKINFPSIPFIYAFFAFAGMPKQSGDGEATGEDIAAMAISLITSATVWGVIAAAVAMIPWFRSKRSRD